MKALVKMEPGAGHWELIDKPEPVINDDQVKIKVEYIGVCGSDIHTFEGNYNVNAKGLTIGHEFAGLVAYFHMPLVQRAPLVQQACRGRHGVALQHSLHVRPTDVDAHTDFVGTQGQRAYTCQILGQRQRGSATEKSERLTVATIDTHAGHAGIVVGCGDKLHSERLRQSFLPRECFVYMIDVHTMIDGLFARMQCKGTKKNAK